MSWITEKLLIMAQQVPRPTKDELNLPDVGASDGFAKNVFGIVFGAVGALAVVTIIIGSMNLAKSAGNPEEISKAKKTILYSIVGLLVVILAEVLVYFVIGSL